MDAGLRNLYLERMVLPVPLDVMQVKTELVAGLGIIRGGAYGPSDIIGVDERLASGLRLPIPSSCPV